VLLPRESERDAETQAAKELDPIELCRRSSPRQNGVERRRRLRDERHRTCGGGVPTPMPSGDHESSVATEHEVFPIIAPNTPVETARVPLNCDTGAVRGLWGLG
jgi:hypothetical protein